MRTTCVYSISADDRLLRWKPEERMVDAVALQRSQEDYWRFLIAIKHEQAMVEGRWLCWRRGHILFSENRRPELHLVIILTIDTSAD